MASTAIAAHLKPNNHSKLLHVTIWHALYCFKSSSSPPETNTEQLLIGFVGLFALHFFILNAMDEARRI